MFELSKYDSFEVHPVVALDGQGNVIPCDKMRETVVDAVEECQEDEVDIYSWAVYGHIPHPPRSGGQYKPPFMEADRGGIFCLADCPDRETAEFIQRLLFKAIGIVIEP